MAAKVTTLEELKLPIQRWGCVTPFCMRTLIFTSGSTHRVIPTLSCPMNKTSSIWSRQVRGRF